MRRSLSAIGKINRKDKRPNVRSGPAAGRNGYGAYPLILEDRTEGFYGKKAILIVEAKEFSQGIVYIFTDWEFPIRLESYGIATLYGWNSSYWCTMRLGVKNRCRATAPQRPGLSYNTKRIYKESQTMVIDPYPIENLRWWNIFPFLGRMHLPE